MNDMEDEDFVDDIFADDRDQNCNTVGCNGKDNKKI